jgi:hypothetical protein
MRPVGPVGGIVVVIAAAATDHGLVARLGALAQMTDGLGNDGACGAEHHGLNKGIGNDHGATCLFPVEYNPVTL